ncbi:sodium transporter [candidate division KSB1 bacterium 4484_188]|nr:MAG: sodium transporter [candidate division KSB1 bacterium 4484_188]
MIDLLIVLAFIIYSISSGFFAQKKASKNLQEYFLAGRTIPGWKAGFSMAATQFAADTPLLVTGLIATAGIFMLWRLWIYGIAFLMMGFIFSIGWRRAGVLTDAELTEVRYSGKGVLPLRVLKAVYYGTVINCVVMAMVLVAAVRIAEVFLPWHQWLPGGIYQFFLNITSSLHLSLGSSVTGLAPAIATTNNLISILVIVGFTTLYSTTGGLRSVVATDVVQFSLAMIGTLIYAIEVVRRIGGLNGIVDKVVDIYGANLADKLLSFAPSGGELLLPFLIIIGLQWFFQMNSDGTGYLAQRSMGCATDKDARIAALVFSWMQIFFRSLIWLIIGVSLLVLYPFSAADAAGSNFAASREILFVTGINDILPVGIRGIMLTAMLAALASTIDTHLNWGASYWSNDIYQRLICKEWLKREPKNTELVLAARLSNILILIIALTIMANLGSIQTAWFISLLFGAGMGSVLVLRWLWERINLFSELAAIIASLIVAPILLILTDAEWIRLGTMALVSTTVAVLVTFVTPATDESVLKQFYQKVRPMGFWRKTAVFSGDESSVPVKKLFKEIKVTFFAAASLFLMLIGVGKLLIPAPGISKLWAIVYLIIALILVPLWWREAVSEPADNVT